MEGRQEPAGPKAAGNGVILAVAVLVLVGIVALWQGAGGLWVQAKLLANGARATGTVEADRWGDSRRPARFVRVAYQDGTGTVRQAEFTVPGGLETALGRPLALRYDPADPAHAAYDDTRWQVGQMLLRLVMTLLGLGMLGLGLWVGGRDVLRAATGRDPVGSRDPD